eukprot:scaffold48075_cov39-Cyclotella_meneghiniana.AAC.4
MASDLARFEFEVINCCQTLITHNFLGHSPQHHITAAFIALCTSSSPCCRFNELLQWHLAVRSATIAIQPTQVTVLRARECIYYS